MKNVKVIDNASIVFTFNIGGEVEIAHNLFQSL